MVIAVSSFIFIQRVCCIGLTCPNSNNDDKTLFWNDNIFFPDPSSPARYFCSHKAGIHCIGLPMVTQLSEMAEKGLSR